MEFSVEDTPKVVCTLKIGQQQTGDKFVDEHCREGMSVRYVLDPKTTKFGSYRIYAFTFDEVGRGVGGSSGTVSKMQLGTYIAMLEDNKPAIQLNPLGFRWADGSPVNLAYNATPTVTGISPAVGRKGTAVTVTGANFSPGDTQ